MENQKINEVVRSTKARYTNGIKDYLTWQVVNNKAALSHKEKYNNKGVDILKALLNTRSAALYDLKHKSEAEYTHNDWAQCMNICNIMYQSVKSDKHPGNEINLKISKAHFNYCCRYYLKTAPKGKRDASLQTIHDINQWNSKPIAEMNLANKIMRNK